VKGFERDGCMGQVFKTGARGERPSRQVSIVTGKDVYGGDYDTRLENAQAEVVPNLFDAQGVNWKYFKKLRLDGPTDEYTFKYKVAVGLLLDRKVLTLKQEGFFVSSQGSPINPTAPVLWGLPTYFVNREDAQAYAEAELEGEKFGIWEEVRRG